MKRTALVYMFTLVAALGLTACGDKDKEDEDTGTVEDTAVEDTGTEDTGDEDTGTEDTGAEDTGAEDTGSDDTGTEDTGMADSGQDTSADTSMDTGTTNDTGDTSAARFEEVNCGSVSASANVDVGPGLSYTPADSTIKSGEVVKWDFKGGTHDVTADDDADCSQNQSDWFQSQTLSSGAYCVRFNETGTWNYHCTVGSHCSSGMKGTVTVN